MAATRIFTRSLLTTKQTLTSLLSRSYTSAVVPLSTPPSSSLSLLRLRPLVAANFHRLSPATTTLRCYSTRRSSTSLNDPNPNWSNRPPKETILLDGCDFEHWLIVLEKPEGDPTRDDIIDSYIKTLAQIVGSEEEARMKIYSVSTRHYFAFGALVSEELSAKLKDLPNVRWVLPDSYLDVRNKDYGGEPFINGQAVPYDPKYHEEWVRNNAKANDRNRRNDRPRNFDRSRNFDRRRENMPNRDFQMNNRDGQNPPGSNPSGAPPYMGSPHPPPGNMGGQPNMAGMPQNNMGGQSNMGGGMPQNNMGGGPPQNNMGGGPPQYNMGGGQPHYNTGGGMPQNNMGGNPQYNNMGGGMPPNMAGRMPQTNMVAPPNMGGGMPPNMGGVRNTAPPNFQYGPNNGVMPPGPGQNREYQHDNFVPNSGGGNPYQTQDMPGRDMPPPPNYQ